MPVIGLSVLSAFYYLFSIIDCNLIAWMSKMEIEPALRKREAKLPIMYIDRKPDIVDHVDMIKNS